jgi:virginiamycin B lyase
MKLPRRVAKERRRAVRAVVRVATIRAGAATLVAILALALGGCGAVMHKTELSQLGSRFAAGRSTHPTSYVPPRPAPPAAINSPYAIVAGAGGIWFTEYSTPAIGQLAPDGAVKLVQLGHSGFPERLTVAPDGSVWFTDPRANRIGRIVAGANRADYHSVPTPQSGPAGIAAAPDGVIWFTEHAANKVAMFVPQRGGDSAPGKHGFKEFALPHGGGPAGIVVAGDSVWFAENSGNRLGRLTLGAAAAKPKITEYPLPISNSEPNSVAAGVDGSVYFTELKDNRIGRVTPQGRLEETVMPVNAPALDITAAPDGTIWMTVPKVHALCRLRPGSPITAFYLPRDAVPAFIAAGADGNLYFTDPSGSIGRFTPAGMLTQIDTAGPRTAAAH